ncbi:protein NPAT isoform X2 [Lampris incognitus]|uniref:protein NPAT isoform X2 n=1 Tax=Lampris incognitus TaxID=2546036 RepID=UPI0024B566F6|nr:protein NPAT isoform X2 [Lampris incognitus]
MWTHLLREMFHHSSKSPVQSQLPAVRSRTGVANMRRQRALTSSAAYSGVCSSASEIGPVISPIHTTHMPGQNTPVSYTAQQSRPASISGTHLQIQEGDLPVHVLIPDQRITSGPMSPGRRKWDPPRRRGSGPSWSSGIGKSSMTVSSLAVEHQPEEQLVIQNAREKILGDRSLQEKLAENINKILASDPTPQTVKSSCCTVESDQSIDEILGLQGEFHMSDDAIHDILEQTESDPAFQALFDLFDYNKTRIIDIEPGEGAVSCSPEESDSVGPPSTDKPPKNEEPGTAQKDATSTPVATPAAGQLRTGQEPKTRKTRKSVVSSSSKKTVLNFSGRLSRLDNTAAGLLVTHEKQLANSPSSATVDSNRGENDSLPCGNGVAPMDVDETLNNSPRSSESKDSQGALQPLGKETTPTITASIITNSTNRSIGSAAPETISVLNLNQMENKQVQGISENTNAVEENRMGIHASPLSGPSCQSSFVSPVLDKSGKTSPQNDLPHVTVADPVSGKNPQPVASSSVTSPESVSTSSPTATPNHQTINPIAPNKDTVEPTNIISLKIIIDEQNEACSSDSALNQAVSSISGDNIPTIFLSSPAKLPARAPARVPDTPQTNQDETAQAVCSLQSSEVLQPVATEAHSVSRKTGVLAAPTLSGTSQTQPSYIFQLPLDATNSPLPRATTSFLLVTDPSAADPQARQVLVPAGIPQGHPSMATLPHSQSYPTASTLVLQSSVQPMMVPVSVMGQNAVGKFQMVTNQLVTVPSPVSIQQPEMVQPKDPTVAHKQSKVSGITQTTEKNVGKLVQPSSAENPGLQKMPLGASPSHRRILCFDSSGEAPPQLHTAKTTTPTTPSTTYSPLTQPAQLTEKDNPQLAPRTKPAILSGNKPKRRIYVGKCTDDTQAGLGLSGAKNKSPQPQQEVTERKTPRKQSHKVCDQKSQSLSDIRADALKPGSLKKLLSSGRSKSVERKTNNDGNGNQAKSKDSSISKSSSSDNLLKSGSRKENEEAGRKDPAEKGLAKSREGRTEKRTSSQESPNVTANKENEIEGSRRELQQQSTSSSERRESNLPPVTAAAAATAPPTSQSNSSKVTSKTSSLAKQAAEMLQDIQGLNSPSTPAKKACIGHTDAPIPPTSQPSRIQEDIMDCPRTPARQRQDRVGEGTPRHPMPPTTPELPTCSPASEAGSENSINMAAHTLMILSRAAIARTGSPLKDSLRQEEIGEKSPTTSKNSKKRKQPSPPASPPVKKELKRLSSSKKKEKKHKKILDCFPDDLDVDKFLSSLHYDE